MENGTLIEVARRTFDTPHFRGIEFIEVEAKSIINHVPGTYLPFSHTINPYRGCSHACSYCAGPDTPILLADGRTRRIADLRVGDEIYGTQFDGKYRRYVKTRVLAHWQTVKPAYRIALEDGTELIASADHRFLTAQRGWKYVTGLEQGRNRRPHLTLTSKLLGTGKFAVQPSHCTEYKRGYLCGMIRGDGHVSQYLYPRSRRISLVSQSRLALTDVEGLQRTSRFLDDFSITTREFLFKEAVGARKAMHGIRCSSSALVQRIEDILRWPTTPSEAWFKGFLAGIFDAEGSYNDHALRICNTNRTIVAYIVDGLGRLGFEFTIEETKRGNGLTYVRLLGGVREVLRFFHTVDPAITRKRSIERQAIKNNAQLRVVAVEPLGIEMPMYDITTGTGDFIANGVVSHNCFARVTHTYLDMNAGRDFESKIVVKVNAPDLLRKELRARRWKGEPIAMGTATDPYQRAEGRYRLMPPIIGTLAEHRNPFSILTKGTLILRDLSLLVDAASATDVSTAFSIGTLDEDVWRRSEPGTPHPRKRIEAVARINAAGIPCGVLVAPVLPGISDSDDQLRDLVRAAVDAGATSISPILLHLRPVVREEFMGWLAQTYPGLVQRYETTYRRAYAPASHRDALSERVEAFVAEAHGRTVETRPASRFGHRGRLRASAPERAELPVAPSQLRLL